MPDNIRKKLIILTFAAGLFLGLAFTSVSYTAWRHCDDKSALLYFASSQAKMIAYNVTCSLSFENNKDANSILESLKTQNYVAFAGVYDKDGRLFAYYYRDDVKQKGFIPPHPLTLKLKTCDGYLVVSEPVIVDHGFVGTVVLWAQM
jgi:diguanylate cyclase